MPTPGRTSLPLSATSRSNPRGAEQRVVVVAAAAPGSSSPERACFDRAALDRGLANADGLLQEGAIGILQRGDQAIVDLNTAKCWAR